MYVYQPLETVNSIFNFTPFDFLLWITGSLFYSTVTLVFRKDVCSDGYVQEEEAIESAYMKLARQFGLKDPGDGRYQ